MNSKTAAINTRCNTSRSLNDRASLDSISKQVRQIRAALQNEGWLPFGLRSVVAEEVAALLRGTNRVHGSHRSITSHVEAMAFAVYAYDELAVKSEVISTALSLDLELREYECPKKLSAVKGSLNSTDEELYATAV